MDNGRGDEGGRGRKKWRRKRKRKKKKKKKKKKLYLKNRKSETDRKVLQHFCVDGRNWVKLLWTEIPRHKVST
jgi:hypothetical protein